MGGMMGGAVAAGGAPMMAASGAPAMDGQYGFAARPQLVNRPAAKAGQGPYRDPYREYM